MDAENSKHLQKKWKKIWEIKKRNPSVETDCNLYLEMRDTHRSLRLQLFMGRLFDAFKREEEEHKAKSEDDSDEEPEPYLI